MPSWLRNTGPGYLRLREEAIARGDVASPRSLATFPLSHGGFRPTP
jgi:hypothetical protein